MKTVTALFLLLLASPVFGELTKDDLAAIRGIVKEEVTASEKRTREYVDLKIDALDKKIDGVEGKLSARIDGLEKSLNARINETNARIDGLDKRMNDMWRLMMGLFGLGRSDDCDSSNHYRLQKQRSAGVGKTAGRISKPKSNNSANRSKGCRNEA